jgi:hypothetical protein
MLIARFTASALVLDVQLVFGVVLDTVGDCCTGSTVDTVGVEMVLRVGCGDA